MHAADPEGLRTQIERASDPAELAAVAGRFPLALLAMAGQGWPPERVCHSLSALGEATARRLILLAEQELGPPPVPYAFIVAGSLARREQIAGADQDNAMIVDETYQAEHHAAYFAELGRRICDGLAACGYIHCPGDIMASNPRWRLTVSAWLGCFGRWIGTPDPNALLNSTIFFDLRCVYGAEALLIRLQEQILRQTRGNRLFQGHLAASALGFRPPLSWYGGIRFRRSGQGEPVMDLKKFGVTPVIDLARVHALAAGDPALSTRARLRTMREDGSLSEAEHQQLLAAFDLISALRIEHQARRIRSGARPDYLMPRSELTAEQQQGLKGAFRCVRGAQRRMARRFGAEAFQ